MGVEDYGVEGGSGLEEEEPACIYMWELRVKERADGSR